MKKYIALVLALALCLSLCACGSSTPEQENNLVQDAPEADFRSIYEECSDNIVAAKDKYIGSVYQFAGTVKSIGEESITVVPMKFPASTYGGWYQVTVFMPKEDIVKVSTQQIINVAGEISELKSNAAEMKQGTVLDDAIAFRGKVSGFFLNEDWTKHIMEVQVVNGNKMISYWFEVADVVEVENITSATINGVTLVEGDYVSGTAKMEAYGAYTDRFNVIEILSIEKT